MPGRGKAALACLLAALIAGCAAADDFPWLATLDAGDGVKASGERLMALPHGLHALEPGAAEAAIAVVAVHGWRSPGYEWVYPMQTLNAADDAGTGVWFYRWDYDGCPGPAADALVEQLANAPFVAKRLRLVGHSYGGVLVAAVAQRWPPDRPIEIHAVAAPLAGVGERCDYAPPDALPDGVRLAAWRTRHELDGAFRAMPVDPQVADIPGATDTLLPETYRGRRLGHNWSISWVADTLAGRDPEP